MTVPSSNDSPIAAAVPPADSAAPSHASPPLRVTAVWHEGDIIDYFLIRTAPQGPTLRRARRNRTTATVIAAGLTLPPILIQLLGPRLFVWADERAVATGITAVVAALAWWTAYGYIAPLDTGHRRRRARAYAADVARDTEHNPSPGTTISFELTSDGITSRTSAVDTCWRWSALDTIRMVASVVEIRHLKGGVSIIPARSFESPDAAAAFVAAARGFLAASGAGGDNRIRTYLAAHDTPCINCGYNLRGVTTRRCPECNHEIDASVVKS